MDIAAILTQLFSSPLLLHVPPPSMISSMLASIVKETLSTIGFEISSAAQALGQIGFKIGEKLIPSLVDAAKKGEAALSNWLENQLAKVPEVNEAMAQMMIKQAENVAQALEKARPADKESVAEIIGLGLQAYGGATKEIAEQYAAAMKDVAKLQTLVGKMEKKLQVWREQSVEARGKSLVKDVRQYMKGGAGGKQWVLARGQSKVIGVTQSIEESGTKKKGRARQKSRRKPRRS